MKRTLLTALMIACLAVPTLTTGCKILQTTDPTTGEVVIDQQKLQQTSALIQTTVANGLTIAISQSPDEADAIRTYGNIVKTAIDELIAGENYDPNALTDAITAVEGVDSPEIKLAINTVLGIYRIYLSESVSGPIADDVVALTLLSAIRDGIALGVQ